MKPKLILLNGPLGIGKSTIAQMYADSHPITLMLDIDNIWSTISHWREQKEISGPLAKKIALQMARIALSDGHDVIIPQILQNDELANSFQGLASESNATYYEVLLYAPKDEAVRRFIERSKSQGHLTGFREGGIIATSGREKKLEEMYDNMITVAENRLHVLQIEPGLNDIEGTYNKLLELVNEVGTD